MGDGGPLFVDAWTTPEGPGGTGFERLLDVTSELPDSVPIPVDGGVDSGWAWIATRDGGEPTLATDVAANGPLGHLLWHQLGRDLAAGIAAIHARGLTFGRLTAGDVIVRASGGEFRSVAALFAGLRGDRAAASPPLAWMTPEIVSGGDPSAASDVFCIGEVLTFAATGRQLWGSQETPAATVVSRILTGDADLESVSADRAHLLSELLQVDPEARPTADQLVAMLSAPLLAAPVTLDPEPPAVPLSVVASDDQPRVGLDADAPPDAEPTGFTLPDRPREVAPPGHYDRSGPDGPGSRRLLVLGGVVALAALTVAAVAFGLPRASSSAEDPAAAPAPAPATEPADRTSPSPSAGTSSPSPLAVPSVRVDYESASIPDKLFVNTLDWTFDVCSTDTSLTSQAVVSKVALYRRAGESWERVSSTPTSLKGGRCGPNKVNLTLDATASEAPSETRIGQWGPCTQYRVVIPVTRKFAKTYVDLCLQVKVDQQ